MEGFSICLFHFAGVFSPLHTHTHFLSLSSHLYTLISTHFVFLFFCPSANPNVWAHDKCYLDTHVSRAQWMYWREEKWCFSYHETVKLLCTQSNNNNRMKKKPTRPTLPSSLCFPLSLTLSVCRWLHSLYSKHAIIFLQFFPLFSSSLKRFIIYT